MIKKLVTEFNTKWVKYSNYEIKEKDNYRYILPKSNAKPIEYNIADVVDEIILDYISIGRAKKEECEDVTDMVLDFVKKYGLLGLSSYFPLNNNYVWENTVLLDSGMFFKDKNIWTVKDYLEMFFPLSLETKFDTSKHDTICIKEKEKTDEEYFSTFIKETCIPFSKYYGEPLDYIIDIAGDFTYKFLKAYKIDFNSPNSKLAQLSLISTEMFKVKALSLDAGVGDKSFSLQWKFTSLVSALETMLLVKLCDTSQPLRICKHCNKLFMAENVRAEYCSLSCRNKANVYKSRSKKK